MDFNNLDLYSRIARYETEIVSDSEKVPQILKKLSGFQNGDEVLEYIENEFGIRDEVLNFPIDRNCVLNYSNVDKRVSIEVVHNKNHSIYVY